MEEFENELVAVFNKSALPLEAKRYVVLSFCRNVENTYQIAKLNSMKKEEIVSEDTNS